MPRVKREYPLRSILRIALNEYELRSIQMDAKATGESISSVGRAMLRRGNLASSVAKNFPDHAPKIAHEDTVFGSDGNSD